MMRKKYLFGIVAAQLANIATPADATLFTVTWQGTLDAGTYCPDEFTCSDITGKAFDVVYTIDDSKGFDASSLPVNQYIYGGSSYGGYPPPVSAVVTIDGFTFSIGGDYQSSAYQANFEPGDRNGDNANHYAYDYSYSEIYDQNSNILSYDYYDAQAYSSVTEGGPALYGTLFDSPDFGSAPTRSTGPNDIISHYFDYYDYFYDYTTGQYSRYDYLVARASSGQWVVDPPSAVPEPATWAMLITGFGFVGGAMRRRGMQMRLAT